MINEPVRYGKGEEMGVGEVKVSESSIEIVIRS